MTPTQALKFLLITPPGAIVDNASPATAEIDTLGASTLDILVIVGATDIALTALKLTESDTTGTNHVDIVGAAYGTSAYPFPTATDDNKLFAFHVDLLGRKRFIDLVATVGDGATGGYVTVIAVLGGLRNSPNSASERGFANQLFV